MKPWISHVMSLSTARPAALYKYPNGRRQITSPWFRDTFSLSRHGIHVYDTFIDSKRLNYDFLYRNGVNLKYRIRFISQGAPTCSIFCPDESQFQTFLGVTERQAWCNFIYLFSIYLPIYTMTDPSPGPTQTSVQWVSCLYPVRKWPELGADHPNPLARKLKSRTTPIPSI